MPRAEILESRVPVTRSQLVADLRRLGLREGNVAMVHTAMSALGWVVGGAQTVVEAVLECVGPAGTLCAQASWEDLPFGLASWPEPWRRAYEAEFPPFDPAISAAAPYEGRLPERIRTWPGAYRSASPATGLVAVGHDAAELTAGHRLDDSFGAGTPYSRLVASDGVVLLLGAPLESISLLHHAEAIARGSKRWTTYRLPVARDGVAYWVAIREIDVWNGAFPYEQVLDDGEPPFRTIATAALAAGIGRCDAVGAARAHLFPAPQLTSFAVRWVETRFAHPSEASTRSTIRR